MYTYWDGLSASLAAANGTVSPPGGPAPDHTLDLDRLRAVMDVFANAAVALSVEANQVSGGMCVCGKCACINVCVCAFVPPAMEAKRSSQGLSESDIITLRSLNDRLAYVDRAFILSSGLPGESWYRHVINSPSLFDTYHAPTFPGVTDALLIGEWRVAQRQLDAVCHLITRASLGMAPVIPY